MAGTAASFIQLASDTGYSGKKIRTQSTVVGANTVHHHHCVMASPREIKGIFYCTFGLHTVVVTAHNGTTTAIGWLVNPQNSTINARLRNVYISFTNSIAAAIDHGTAPRIAVQRFSQTGQWTGASQTIAKKLTSDSSAQCGMFTASTGGVISLLSTQLYWAATTPGSDITATGVFNSASAQEWKPEFEDDFLEIMPTEGLLIYQIDAGTTSDQRKALVRCCWDEVDIT